MDSLRIGPNEYNLDFVVYGSVSANGFMLHFIDNGTVAYAMSEGDAQATLLLLPESKRSKPESKAKGKAKTEAGEA